MSLLDKATGNSGQAEKVSHNRHFLRAFDR